MRASSNWLTPAALVVAGIFLFCSLGRPWRQPLPPLPTASRQLRLSGCRRWSARGNWGRARATDEINDAYCKALVGIAFLMLLCLGIVWAVAIGSHDQAKETN